MQYFKPLKTDRLFYSRYKKGYSDKQASYAITTNIFNSKESKSILDHSLRKSVMRARSKEVGKINVQVIYKDLQKMKACFRLYEDLAYPVTVHIHKQRVGEKGKTPFGFKI